MDRKIFKEKWIFRTNKKVPQVPLYTSDNYYHSYMSIFKLEQIENRKTSVLYRSIKGYGNKLLVLFDSYP